MGFLNIFRGKKETPRTNVPDMPPSQKSLQEIDAEIKSLQDQRHVLFEQAVALSNKQADTNKEEIKRLFFSEPWSIWFVRDDRLSSGGEWRMYSEPLADKIRQVCGDILAYPYVIDHLRIDALSGFDIWANSNYVSMVLKDDHHSVSVVESSQLMAKAIFDAGLVVDSKDVAAEAQFEQDLANGFLSILRASRNRQPYEPIKE